MGRSGNDLDEFVKLHLIDRIWQCLHNRRDAQEKLGMCIHEAVSHGGPVIEAMVRAANPRLFFVVASDQRRIKSCDRLLNRGPFALTISIFGGACLQASLVCVRARIPDVLIPICLGEEEAEADTTCQFGSRWIEALGSCDSRCQVNNILEWSGGV